MRGKWFDNLSPRAQRAYLAKHPNSKLATRAKGYKRHMQRAKTRRPASPAPKTDKWSVGAFLKRVKG
jgi:hypothetical protein